MCMWSMMKHSKLLLLLFVGMLAFSACEPSDDPLVIDEESLVGTWSASDNRQEYWRFDIDKTGETWDESEDVQEGEGTRFNWSTVEDQLRIDLYGEMGQHVYYDYTVTLQTVSTITWKDQYGNHRTFTKNK